MRGHGVDGVDGVEWGGESGSPRKRISGVPAIPQGGFEGRRRPRGGGAKSTTIIILCAVFNS